ncbi:transposase, IS605 OrfB family [Candidatus Desulfofervidus auxilii]|uniref:Transposase, IS605 OrfB family n=1 Tax=Desulfofervidus auxilii TaxID=1621989 RepID=A0A7U4QJY8_DESA2|nr:RNA-guided endonuclease TnpB family protein [Candidatus Desulfofervidus auxilii]AMM40747.1 transposase, IS605 OrfB family [Candidatus Desulfofervidus auxilii]CAD7774335.1 putative transposase [Candidatus Methanoperedenaceae archaeon GB50]CAD7775656.1 putative transposase [Candidatus Methanoperedenaceae archaeon GB37]
MIVRQAYKFRLKTNEELEQKLVQFSGCCRFVWNKAIALIKFRLDHNISIPWYNDMAGFLGLWKRSEEYAFLNDAHSQILQQTLKDLYKAIESAFARGNGIRFPKFKKKYRHDSFRYPQGVKIDNRRIFLPKIGWVRFYKSREIEGKIKQVIVKREYKHWYVSVITEKEVEPITRLHSPIGIDLGVRKIITLSDGTYFKPLDLTKLEKKLKREQRRLAKKKKFSKNWYKQKARITKLWQKIKNKRYDYVHKLSTAIAKNHGIVVVEDLRIKNMTRSARGTIDNPGYNVKQKAGLNRSILRQAWGIFLRLLEYKLEWSGGRLVVVNPRYSSFTCPVCGLTSRENRKSQARFVCENCGFEANADFVAALNILERGFKNLSEDLCFLTQKRIKELVLELSTAGTAGGNACGGSALLPVKQEPAGNREGVMLPVKLKQGILSL